ncbi:MAG: tail fiber domain-containing protein [Synechococcaceae bacterium WB7_1B_046]|nr:tail fiber domain-containing protein [Synechococcaceae bacterium WB7_1B_046]
MNLRGVEYDRVDTNSHQLGLIAQEVEKVIPEIVHGDSTKSIAYDSLIPVLIEAIKELKNEIEELKNNK